MLSEDERARLKAIIVQGNMGRVPDEELHQYPAVEKQLKAVSSQGETRVFAYESGEKKSKRPLIIHFHGGGFIKGRTRRDELFCRKMACRFGALVLDVDYCLAPEYPYPAAVTESWDVVRWIWDHREELEFDAEQIVLIGHSAGGNLAAGVGMRLGETSLFVPRCMVLNYPPLDLASDPAQKKRTSCDMPADQARGYNRKYIQPERSREPYASPLYGPDQLLAKFPDTLVISAGEDSLCEEDEAFAVKLACCGVTVTLRRFTDSIHGFVMSRMCEWKEAEALIERYVEQHIRENTA